MNTKRQGRGSNKKISNNQAKRNFPADFFDSKARSLDRRSTLLRCQTEETGQEYFSAQSSR
jgi:hypothetical protein